jgi:hypothetical protein
MLPNKQGSINMWRTVTVPMHLCEILRECAYKLDSASHCAAKQWKAPYPRNMPSASHRYGPTHRLGFLPAICRHDMHFCFSCDLGKASFHRMLYIQHDAKDPIVYHHLDRPSRNIQNKVGILCPLFDITFHYSVMFRALLLCFTLLKSVTSLQGSYGNLFIYFLDLNFLTCFSVIILLECV